MQDFRPIPGTSDYTPDYHKYYTFLKKVFRHEFRKNGFRRLSTPIVERTDMYEEVFGNEKDKYVCTFDGCGSLRPNASIGVMRAYLNGEFDDEIQPVYFYYMDRYFSTLKGNFEEFNKIGADIIGENDPILDALLVYLMYSALKKIELSDAFVLRINSIGVEKEQLKYIEELRNFYENKKHLLSQESLELLEKHPMKLLASSGEDEQILAKEAPSMQKFLKKDSKAHYIKVKEYLDVLGVEYVEDHTLIPEYEYRTHTVWQFRAIDDGEVISWGGRYNKLANRMGIQKEIPAVGFSSKVDTLIKMLRDKDIQIRNKDKIDLYFVQLGDEAKKVVLPLSIAAREAGINTTVSLGTPSMKEQMLKAQRSGANFVVMVGIMEARNGVFQVRDQISGTQAEVKKEVLIEYIIDKIGKDTLDFYCPARDLVQK